MTLAEYEVVREQDDRFALAPGHENEELEQIVARNDRFVIVDKIDALQAVESVELHDLLCATWGSNSAISVLVTAGVSLAVRAVLHLRQLLHRPGRNRWLLRFRR